MFIRESAVRQYSVGYFARKHGLERDSAKLILSVARDPIEANRLARSIKFAPKDFERSTTAVVSVLSTA